MQETASQLDLSFRPLARMARMLGSLRKSAQGVLTKASPGTLALVLCPSIALAGAVVIMANLKHVEIIENGKSKSVTTFCSNPSTILEKNGIPIKPHDKFVFSGFKSNYGTINFYPAFRVKVTADNKTSEILMSKGDTVTDALKKVGVTLKGEDILSAPLSSELSLNELITVKRVTYGMKTNYKPIAFKTETQTTIQLKKGTRVLLRDGKAGQTAVKSKIKYIDGKEVYENVVSVTVSKNPTSREVLVGTAASTPLSSFDANGLILDKNGKPVHYSRVYSGSATAYSARAGSLTASGRRLKVGYIAVNPRKIPYGSKLYIMTPDGSFVYGVAVAADTGAFVSNGSGVLTDLYFPSNSQCERFGVREVNIYVLN